MIDILYCVQQGNELVFKRICKYVILLGRPNGRFVLYKGGITMANTFSKTYELAFYLIDKYESISNIDFGSNELKLQKLMYFVQRQSLALTGEPIINENFEGWVHGPVLVSLRNFFDFKSEFKHDFSNLSEKDKYIIDNVLYEYGHLEAWKLRNLSHEEHSWKVSRNGLSDDEVGNVPLKIEDIKIDAQKVRLYDHLFDMYIDEFEDFPEGECLNA